MISKLKSLGLAAIFAQLLGLVGISVIGHLYDQESVGVFAILIAVSAISLPVVNLRLDLAIVTSDSEERAYRIFGSSLYLVLIISPIYLALSIIYLNYIKINTKIDGYLLIFLFLSFFSPAMYQTSIALINRLDMYGVFSRVRIMLPASLLLLQVLLVALGTLTDTSALLASYSLSYLVCFLYMLICLFRINRGLLNLKLSLPAELRTTLPSIFSSLLNIISSQILVIVISKSFIEIAAFIYLAMRLISVPTGFLSLSFSPIYFRLLSQSFNDLNYLNMRRIFNKSVTGLSILSVACIVLIFIIPSQVYVLVFGSQYENIGFYLKLLSPILFGQIITSSLSNTLNAMKMNGSQLVLDVLRNIIVLSCALGIFVMNIDISLKLSIFAFTSCLTYMIYIFFYAFKIDRLNRSIKA